MGSNSGDLMCGDDEVTNFDTFVVSLLSSVMHFLYSRCESLQSIEVGKLRS